MKERISSQQEKMLRGTSWMTISSFISRFLGAIYIIPWYFWMGRHAAVANGLFNMGYTVYALILLLSTAGIPVAVAKQIASYNARNQEEKSYQLVRTFLIFMLCLGGVFALFMYLASPFLARLSGVGDELIPVMRSLSWAVFLFPSMSVIRGFFQGFNDLKPYAISQIAEQGMRIIWMLLATYFIMNLGSKQYVSAVTQSTFAAFIGMLASIAVLIWFLHRSGKLDFILRKTPPESKVDNTFLLKQVIREAIPFVVLGSAIQIFQMIDQWTFVNSMTWFTQNTQDQSLTLFSYFAANPSKITMILIGVATAIGGVGIPLLTENYVNKDKKATAALVLDNLTTFFLFLFPATLGGVLLARPIYLLFYNEAGNSALSLFIGAMWLNLFLGFYTILSPFLQAISETRAALSYFLYGILLKCFLQIPFIFLFKAYGPLLSTAFGIGLSNWYMYQKIQTATGFSNKWFCRRLLLIGILSAITALFICLVTLLLQLFIPITGRVSSLFSLLLVGGGAMVLYIALTLRMRLMDRFLGKEKAQALRQKFHIS